MPSPYDTETSWSWITGFFAGRSEPSPLAEAAPSPSASSCTEAPAASLIVLRVSQSERLPIQTAPCLTSQTSVTQSGNGSPFARRTSTTLIPPSSFSLPNSPATSSRDLMSSPAIGSSSNSNTGRVSSAAAIRPLRVWPEDCETCGRSSKWSIRMILATRSICSGLGGGDRADNVWRNVSLSSSCKAP